MELEEPPNAGIPLEPSKEVLENTGEKPQKSKSCALCGQQDNLTQCPRCKMIHYCSSNHQEIDWPNHKHYCNLWMNDASIALNSTELEQQCENDWERLKPKSQLEENNDSNKMMPTKAVSHRNSTYVLDGKHDKVLDKQPPKTPETNGQSASEQRTTLIENILSQVPSARSPVSVAQSNPPTSDEHLFIRNLENCDSRSKRIHLKYTPTVQNDDLCRNIINDMNQYGLSVVDDFLGAEKGLKILAEVHRMYSAGVFQDGQVVKSAKTEKQQQQQPLRMIRGDKITWVKGNEENCPYTGYLINQIDNVICRASTMANNGILSDYLIRERTKAMVACYPGSGARYVMHVDNPNRDGRVITAIYYLNLNWDAKRSGGVLRIFPKQTSSVADIEPKFDRLILFWSDKRNPHEVQPAHRTRYAITVWYFDANEREEALNRCKNAQEQ